MKPKHCKFSSVDREVCTFVLSSNVNMSDAMLAARMLNPRESGELIAKLAKDVNINRVQLNKLAQELYQSFKAEDYNLRKWKEHELHPQEMSEDSINWIFLGDTLNFSFWADDDKHKFGVNFNGKLHTGYWSLHAAIQRARKEGIHITSPLHWATMTKEEFNHFLRSDTKVTIPLLNERFIIFKEAADVLLKDFNGSFVNCIQQCNHSGQKLIELVVSHMPSYRDETEYVGHKVSFYKRAQILVADIWALYEGKDLGAFDDINSLTMFADYRVPQVLAHFGVLTYSDDLMEKLLKDKRFHTGDRQEVEIRGCSIWAVELLKEEIENFMKKEKGTSEKQLSPLFCSSPVIDFYLWDFRRSHAEVMDVMPFHKIRCIYY